MCCCIKRTRIVFRRGKFQLSNFYRHLQGLANECPALKQNMNNPPLSSPSMSDFASTTALPISTSGIATDTNSHSQTTTAATSSSSLS